MESVSPASLFTSDFSLAKGFHASIMQRTVKQGKSEKVRVC